MAIEYCNTTTDLTNAHRDIDRYKGYFERDSTKWTLDTGAIYKQYETGYVSKVFEDGVPLTAYTGASIDAQSKYYYDSTNDVLYIWCTGSVNPNTLTIETGETWTTFKTTCRNDAQELLEGFLRELFVIPFRKISPPRQSYNSEDYDIAIRRGTALLTCFLIINRLNPMDKVADILYKEVFNQDPEIGERWGIIQMITEGHTSLNIQKANREPGGFNVYDSSSNASTGFIEIFGYYTGGHKEIWRLQIDTAGAVGTATYKLSRDQGSNWDVTTQATRDASNDARRKHLSNGIYVEFVGTFTDGDYWDIELFPDTDRPSIKQFNTVRVNR